MKTIWKYPLAVDGQQQIEVPTGARPLTVQVQGKVPCLWALVDPSKKPMKLTVRMYDTGEVIGVLGQYLGTVQLNGGSLVSHVFVDAEDHRVGGTA